MKRGDKRILVIKLAALGDVLRTTPILRVLDGEITWLTKAEALPLLKTKFVKRAIAIENKNEVDRLKKEKFDIVLSLDEDFQAAKIASQIKTDKLIGVYLDGNKTSYTDDSKGWFDMSLISKYGLSKANELKKINRLSYQEHLFSMTGKKFSGEEYVLPVEPKKVESIIIGVEKRVGEKWAAKKWAYYDLLVKILRERKFKVKILRYRKNLLDYVRDINSCSIIVCGDTLAMHIGLGLKKRVVAIFTCTSPQEIYDYGRMVKVVNPDLDSCFYTRKFDPKIAKSVPFEMVYQALMNFIDECRGKCHRDGRKKFQ